MSNDADKLRASLAQLKRQLNEAISLDPTLAAQLRATIAEIEATLTGSASSRTADGTIRERLADAALDFEASHPTLAGTLGSVVDALGRMGI